MTLFAIVHFLVQKRRDSRMHSVSLYSEKFNTAGISSCWTGRIKVSGKFSLLYYTVSLQTLGLRLIFMLIAFFSACPLTMMSYNEYRKYVT